MKTVLEIDGSPAVIIRIRNIYSAEPKTADLVNLLSHYKIDANITELALSENQTMDELLVNKYDWDYEGKVTAKPNHLRAKLFEDFTSLVFNSGQVRIFKINFN